MGSPLTSSQFVYLVQKRLKEVGDGVGKGLASMIPVLYRVMSSEDAWEEFYNIGEVPDIPEFNGKMTLLGLSPGYHTKIEPIEFGGMLNIERKLIDDRKYTVMDNFAAKLMKAGLRTKEKKGAETFVNAFSSAFTFMTSEEGVALCSDSHTTKSGTSTSVGFDNAGTSALNKTNLAATQLLMKNFRNDISERIQMGNWGLIVPGNLADTAYELNFTEKGLDTAEGNVNPMYKRFKIIVYDLLDSYDSNNWFMVDLDKMKENLIWINRIMEEIETQPDFISKMLMVSIYFRIACGFKDWRWIYGHNVS